MERPAILRQAKRQLKLQRERLREQNLLSAGVFQASAAPSRNSLIKKHLHHLRQKCQIMTDMNMCVFSEE